MDNTANRGQNTYLFNIEVLMEGETNAHALEALLHLLNRANVPDYRIISGSRLGFLIDRLKAETLAGTAAPETELPGVPIPAEKTRSNDPAACKASLSAVPLTAIIRSGIEEKKLIRLSVNKGKGVKLDVPARMIHFDEETKLLTVYHVDEKQVYTFHLHEIDDFTV
ncbi:hypothetical protein [Paenibacillus beijingensis]|uniref:Uncharacterized protein n=1 Tax=Paenibacillus beijingensis TaxID=1126833 RepID=A0A0D5NLC3_9BACL|nr:hypothetical protein [Paenibacillus beijingensis]AJY75950.1 hypothetical protein VN24_17065 [Paenibacillus beijingensis]